MLSTTDKSNGNMNVDCSIHNFQCSLLAELLWLMRKSRGGRTSVFVGLLLRSPRGSQIWYRSHTQLIHTGSIRALRTFHIHYTHTHIRLVPMHMHCIRVTVHSCIWNIHGRKHNTQYGILTPFDSHSNKSIAHRHRRMRTLQIIAIYQN